MTFKTKAAALKAARKELGEASTEGMDFVLRNTGAGWVHEPIPPANEPAVKAQASRASKAATPKAPNRSAGAKSGHVKRGSPATQPEATTKTALLVGMMSTPAGATSKAMEEAVSWAPHSVRGLVGSLKKKGVPVESLKDQGSPVRYRIPMQDEDVI